MKKRGWCFWGGLIPKCTLWHCTRLLPVPCVGPWLTGNFYEENNLYNVISTMSGQHFIGILFSQCCPNTSETTLHKRITCAMLSQSTQTCFLRKITYTMSWSVCANDAEENYLWNVGPQPMYRKLICNIVLI